MLSLFEGFCVSDAFGHRHVGRKDGQGIGRRKADHVRLGADRFHDESVACTRTVNAKPID